MLKLLNQLGPGLLYAGAAVGVSHLVMSTKAGALYGFGLMLLIPLIHLIKYPFYRFGPEYTAITGKNILHGYYRLGTWAIGLYMTMTIITMCLIQAAVTIVTSSIAVRFFKLDIPPEWMPHGPAIFILLMAASLLAKGKYTMLDKMMKIIILILTVTTIIAVTTVLWTSPSGVHEPQEHLSISQWFDGESLNIMFLAAFLGWMPAPMDISVWHSVWSEEANQEQGQHAGVRKALLDFNVGFFGTAGLAMCFLALGALVMFGGPETPSPKGAVFAGQLIDMYTSALGSWAYPLIGIAALTTMFSTTITCLDAYPRTLAKSWNIIKGHQHADNRAYRPVLCLATALTVVVFFYTKQVQGSMGTVVTVATLVSFIATPILAGLNMFVMMGPTVSKDQQPSFLMKVWCWLGLAFLMFSSAMYLWIKFG